MSFKKLTLILMVVVFASMLIGECALSAEKPKGQKMSSHSTFDYTISATATKRDTSNAMWKMSSLEDFSSLHGRVYGGYYSDGLAGAGGTIDTSKDTIYLSILTNSASGWFNDTTIWVDTIVPVDSVFQVVEFDISDSGYYEFVYLYVITNVNDAAPVGSTATYQVYYELYAK